MLQLYFIRHAQSSNNVHFEDESKATYFDKRLPDPDLTALGVEQAEILAKYLNQPYTDDGFDPHNQHGFGLTHLYTSLMLRAVRTGYAVSQATGCPLVAWHDIHETGGVFEIEVKNGEPLFINQPGVGRSFLESSFPGIVLPNTVSESGWWNKGIEPRENYHKRAKKIVGQIIKNHGGTSDRVGLILHGGIFARIMTALLEINQDRYWFLMNNCAISRVDIEEQGQVNLIYLNSVEHLPDRLIT